MKVKAKAALDTVSTVVPSVVGMGIGVGVVTPTLFLSFIGADDVGYGALVCTIVFLGGEWIIAPIGVASTVGVGALAGGVGYWVSSHLINDCINCVSNATGGTELTGEHAHFE